MEQGLLDALRESPDDWVTHLVYADWLEDQGQSDRADFIRAWWNIERSSNLRERTARHKELADRFQGRVQEWIGPTPPLRRAAFEGAVLARLEPVDRPAMSEVAPLLERLAIRDVALHRTPTAIELARLPSFANLHGLTLTGDWGRFDELCIGPNSPRLRRLTFSQGLDTYCARMLAKLPRMTFLRSLRCTHGTLDDAGVVALLRSPYLHGLEEWHVVSRRVTSLSLLHLFRNGRARRWKALTYCVFDGPTLNPTLLAECENLERLSLTLPSFPGAADAIGNLRALSRLRELRLTGAITGEMLRPLADWPGLAHLERLSIASSYLAPEDVQRLLQSPYRNLDTLMDLPGVAA